MINITLSDEQVISLIDQLPQNKKKELLEHLLFEEWLDSPEGQQLMKERENDFENGKTLTLDELKEKLKVNG